VKRRTLNLAALSLLFTSFALGGEPVPGDRPGDRVILRHDRGAARSEIVIEASAGEVAWSDVLAALSRLEGFDEAAVRDVLPGGSFAIGSFGAELAILGLNLALSPAVRLSAVGEAESGRQALRVVVDHAAMEARGRSLKRAIRRSLLGVLEDDGTSRGFGLFPDPAWREAPLDRPLVVVVHGIGLPSRSIGAFIEELRGHGFPAAFFRYPGSQPIAESAALFSQELRTVARAEPARRVRIVGLSMGGLVARAAIEDPDLDPGNVDRLIMVATPTRGSKLAPLEPLLEAWIGLRRFSHAENPFRGALEDGLGEAGEDLRPGSSFLTRLNSRPRNPRVRYSQILGNGGPLGDAEVGAARECLQFCSRHNRLARFLGKPVEEWLGDLDEVVRGKGDAAVALKRGRLEGVEDTVVLGFDHLKMLDPHGPAARELRQAILERLRGADLPRRSAAGSLRAAPAPGNRPPAPAAPLRGRWERCASRSACSPPARGVPDRDAPACNCRRFAGRAASRRPRRSSPSR